AVPLKMRKDGAQALSLRCEGLPVSEGGLAIPHATHKANLRIEVAPYFMVGQVNAVVLVIIFKCRSKCLVAGVPPGSEARGKIIKKISIPVEAKISIRADGAVVSCSIQAQKGRSGLTAHPDSANRATRAELTADAGNAKIVGRYQSTDFAGLHVQQAKVI